MTNFTLINQVRDAFVCELERFEDERGFFEELYSHKDIPFQCQQANFSQSHSNVIRGIHVTPYFKLVHCVKGKIFDVVVDLRKDSKTYLQWYGVELTENNKLSFYIPPYCGHGFMAMEDSLVIYAQGGTYDPKLETSVYWQDPTLHVMWPLIKMAPTISQKDMLAPLLKESVYA
jgi:dTDP-4-dehydrorhamnose 3,5-epimerase